VGRRGEEEVGTRYTLPGQVSSDLLSPTKCYLLTFSPPHTRPFNYEPINEAFVDEIRALVIPSLCQSPILNMVALETKPSTHEPLGEISDPNHNTRIFHLFHPFQKLMYCLVTRRVSSKFQDIELKYVRLY
jgi:hypothetical protein